MAESSNRDINLRIRAKDYSKKTLQDLQKSIDALTKAQEDQQKAAQNGETTSRSLEKSYQDLEKATKAAVRQVADIKAFENQSKALDGARAATTAAQDAFQNYERTLKNTPKVTAEQTKELNSLRKEMVNAEKDEQRQSARLDALAQRLKAYGIATNDTQGALSKLEQSVNKANGSLEKQEKAIGDNEAALKRLKKAEEDAANQAVSDALDRQRKALEGVANDAVAAANGWRSVATSTKSFGDAATPATAAINAMLGVTGPLGRSIKEVDVSMRTMAADLNASTTGIDNSKAKIKELADAQRQLTKAAGLVDTFRQQMDTLRQSRQEYSAAQKNVRDLAAQLKNAGDGAKDIQNKLSVAQTTLGRSAKSFRDNADAAQQTRAQLNQLGITTKTVADAESQLIGTTNQITNAQRAMNDAIGRGATANISEQTAAMNKAASEARSMAVGLSNVATSATPVADAIRNIATPANQANSTLAKMEENTTLLANAFATIRRPVQDATKKMQMLADAQQAIKNTAGLIDTFNQQKTALSAARTEYKNAQQQLRSLSQEAQSGAVSESELASRVDAATQKVRSAAAAFRDQANSTKVTRDRLREAGVDTNNLAAAEDRLSQSARNAKSAEDSLSQAIEKFGRTSRQAMNEAKSSAMSVEGAITKLKNEVIGLTSAYTGLQGAMTLTNNVVESSIKRQQFMSQSAMAVGTDTKKQTEQWEYIGKLSEKWGLDMAATSKDYSRFLVSVTKSGGTVDDAKSMFEDLAIIGRANNLTGDEFHRMIYAFDQMLSQGQIMTSELKLQLGNVLPGAYEMAAIKLNGTTQGFREKLQEGFYKMDAIFALPKAWAKDAMGAASKASEGIIAAQNRLKNATNEFNLQIADSGFIDSYTEVIKKITALMRSDEGANFAKKIGGAMTTAADAALWLAKHIDLVIGTLKVLVGLLAAKAIIGFAGTIQGMWVALQSFRTMAYEAAAGVSAMERSLIGARYATTALTWGMKALGWAVPFIGWALLIMDFVTAVYQASDTFRDFCWDSMKFWKAVIDYFYNLLTGAYKDFQSTLAASDAELNQYRSDEDKKRLGIKSPVKIYEEDKTTMIPGTGMTAAMYKKMSADGKAPTVYQEQEDGTMKQLNNLHDQEEAAAEVDRLTKESSRTFDEMDQRRERFNKETEKDNKRLAIEEKRQKRKSYKEDLEERLNMVREEYQARIDEGEALDKSGKTQDSRMKAEQNMNKALAIERTKFWNEVGKQEEEKARQRAEKIKGIEATIQQNRDSIESSAGLSGWNSGNYAEREEQYIAAQVEKYKDLESQIRKVGGAEAERLQAQVEGLKQTTAENARQAYQLAEIERYNKQIKNLEDERNAQLSVLKAQKDNYQLTDSEYIDKVNGVYNQAKQGLLDATTAAEKFGEANRNAFKTDAEYAQWKAQLSTFRIETETSGNQLAEYQKQAATGLAQSLNTGFSALVDNITAVTQGTQSWGDAFQNTATAMLQYFAQLLQQIAMTILEAAIMNALLGGAPAASGAAGASGGGWVSSTMGALGSAGKNHNGGMAGSSGIGKVRVSPLAFANAQRYHTGGMIGLQPDEVPIIAQKGEEMLTRDDPRNRLNGGLNGGSGGNTRIIAVDDHRSAITEAMKTPEGEKAVITVLRRNLSTVKKMTS